MKNLKYKENTEDYSTNGIIIVYKLIITIGTFISMGS
jgi:hypothetical protein